MMRRLWNCVYQKAGNLNDSGRRSPESVKCSGKRPPYSACRHCCRGVGAVQSVGRVEAERAIRTKNDGTKNRSGKRGLEDVDLHVQPHARCGHTDVQYVTPLNLSTDRFRTATAEFALRLYRSLETARDKNVVLAPALAAFPLLPLLSIANGDTRQEIKNALFLADLDDDILHSQFEYAYDRLNQNGRRYDQYRPQWRPHGIKVWELHPVNLLLIKESLLPTGDYWNDTRARNFVCYKNKLHGVRLVKNFDTKTIRDLDTFVEKETKGTFVDSQVDVSDDFNMAMVSSMSYSGIFINGFRVDIEKRAPFHVSEDDVIDCTFICNNTLKEYASSDELELQVLGLEYTWGSLTLYIFLPNRGVDLVDMEQQLTAERVIELLKLAQSYRVEKHFCVKYQVPAFRIRQSHNLSNVFREKMNMPSLFDSSKINLNTFETEKREMPMAMGPVTHHACITVAKDNRGELHRFTRPLREKPSVLCEKPSAEEYVDFVADRPFFYLVCDIRAQIFLFMGRVMNPNIEE